MSAGRTEPPRCGEVNKYILRVMVALIGIAAPAGAAEKDPLPPTLVLVDGSIMPAPSLTIANERVTGDKVPADLTLDDLQRIRTPDIDDFPQTNVNARIFLPGNSQLWASQITIADDKARIEGWGGQPLVLPVDVLRAIRLDVANDSPEFEKSLATPSAEKDRLFIKGDDEQINVVSGLVEALDAEVCKFEVGGQIRSVARKRICGAVFAQPAAATKQPRFVVAFRDRSRLSGENFSLASGKATLSLTSDAIAQFDWSVVGSVAIRSSRLAYLSDWPSINEVQTPIVTLPFPAQRDKSVSGGSLKIGVQKFDKGLGVHSRSRLTFPLGGKWDLFAANIGLDDETQGQGDCIFQVFADEKCIFERRRTGADSQPADLNLPITDCQQLTLVVEPGEGLDLADHADWCDARLIKAKQ
jgi:hypothetical protein